VLVAALGQCAGVSMAALGESLGRHLLEPTTVLLSGAAIFVGTVVEGATFSPCGFSPEETLPG